MTCRAGRPAFAVVSRPCPGCSRGGWPRWPRCSPSSGFPRLRLRGRPPARADATRGRVAGRNTRSVPTATFTPVPATPTPAPAAGPAGSMEDFAITPSTTGKDLVDRLSKRRVHASGPPSAISCSRS